MVEWILRDALAPNILYPFSELYNFVSFGLAIRNEIIK